MANGLKALIGDDDWSQDSGSRLYKLYHSTMKAFEEKGRPYTGQCYAYHGRPVKNAERVSELWSDNKRSYILVFGFERDGVFVYPKDSNAFLAYFNNCIDGIINAGESPDCSHKVRSHNLQSIAVLFAHKSRSNTSER